MKRLRLCGSIVVAILVLSACQITVTPTDPFPNAESRQAVTDPFEAVASASLTPGARDEYEIMVPADQRSSTRLLYLELDATLDLRVYSRTGSLVASSMTAEYFGTKELGLSPLSGGIASAGIRVPVTCRGSCVLLPANTDRVFLSITNETNSTASYNLYAFTDITEDTTETQNNNPDTAPVITTATSSADFEKGAIETLGDVDYYYVDVNTSQSFLMSTQSLLPLRARIHATDGQVYELTPNQRERVFNGDIIEIFVEGGNYAAPSSESTYILELPAP